MIFRLKLIMDQTEEHVLRFDNSKITGENTFNGDHFATETNHG